MAGEVSVIVALSPAETRTGSHYLTTAVELPEGIVVLGQVAAGFGVDDLRVGSEVELVVEPLYTDETGDRTIWRCKPVVELGEEADQ
jgi:uncharacterized OB-fold protein